MTRVDPSGLPQALLGTGVPASEALLERRLLGAAAGPPGAPLEGTLPGAPPGPLEDLSGGQEERRSGVWVPEPELAFRMGLAFTRTSCSRMAWAARAEQSLSHLTGGSEWRLVHELLGLLALWVLDLPASESHHHRRRFGLLDHSLEVGAGTIQGLEARWRTDGSARTLKPLERALGSRVAFVLGLLHDVGKVQDLIVVAGPRGTAWDPLREPLAGFKRRHGLRVLAPTPFRHCKGRGLRGHLEHGKAVASVLFSGRIGRDLGPFLGKALDSYAAYCLRPGRPLRAAFDDLKPLVSAADQASGKSDLGAAPLGGEERHEPR